MNSSVFYKQISILSGCLFVFLALLSMISAFKDTLPFSIGVAMLFAVFTIAVFHLGMRTINSADKNSFMMIAISSIFLKLVFSLMILFSYQLAFEPPTKLYLLPFLIIYLAYTALETTVLMKLAKSSE